MVSCSFGQTKGTVWRSLMLSSSVSFSEVLLILNSVKQCFVSSSLLLFLHTESDAIHVSLLHQWLLEHAVFCHKSFRCDTLIDICYPFLARLGQLLLNHEVTVYAVCQTGEPAKAYCLC